MQISAVLPAHNEEANIEQAVSELQDVLGVISTDDTYEVIVVNDGSTDRTGEIVDKMGELDPRVKLITHETNLGYGQAVKTGLQAVSLDYLFFNDYDMQFYVSELERLVPHLDRADVVCGYRIERQDEFKRRFFAASWNYLVRVLFYVPVRDIDCAFKIFRREALDGLEIESMGALINTELMVKLGRSGYGVAEVGVNHFPRVGGEQSGAKLSVIFLAFNELRRMHRTLKRIDTAERHYARRRAARSGRI